MIKAETAYRVLWLDSYVLKEASINKGLLMYVILTARHLVRMTAVTSSKGRASNWWENGIEGVLSVTVSIKIDISHMFYVSRQIHKTRVL